MSLGGGSFTAELIGRVMRRAVRLSAHDEAQGQTEDGSSHLPSKQGGAGELVEDLETLFARYSVPEWCNELDETGETDLATTPETRDQQVADLTDEFQRHLARAEKNVAVSQLALF